MDISYKDNSTKIKMKRGINRSESYEEAIMRKNMKLRQIRPDPTVDAYKGNSELKQPGMYSYFVKSSLNPNHRIL